MIRRSRRKGICNSFSSQISNSKLLSMSFKSISKGDEAVSCCVWSLSSFTIDAVAEYPNFVPNVTRIRLRI